jgi:lipopolysaccharide/colanic/teichoic acid biosynthesis glycosyltransferase
MYPTDRSHECLFVGFGSDFDAKILHFPYENAQLCYARAESAEAVRQWLDQRRQSPAIKTLICSLPWLQSRQFQLTRHMIAHPLWRHIPVIALSEPDQPADMGDLALAGIDDCYTIPVEWRVLQERLAFLHQYKPKLLELAAQNRRTQEFQYRISPGKRIFDVLGASIGLLLSAPLWLLIAAAIRLESKGPVIYTSKRVGAGFRVFDFFKFRSMQVGADRQLDEFGYLNQYKSNGRPVFVKLTHDPRVTRVGRFIRRYSLDELPQLINVLRGEMSLVGNRPLPVYEAEMLVKDEWCERFLAPAGLTGLWQVSKRGQDGALTEERIRLDIAYSRNASIWQDLRILARTFRAVVQHANV